MAFCRTLQPPGVDGVNSHGASHCSSTALAAPSNTSSLEWFHLFPCTSTIRSHTWISRKASPLWLQYLAQLLADHSTQSAWTTASSPPACARVHIRPGVRSATTTKGCSYASISQSVKHTATARRVCPTSGRILSSHCLAQRQRHRKKQLKNMGVKSGAQPTHVFHMTTRSRAARTQTPEVSPSSDSSPLSACGSSSAAIPSLAGRGQKRKASEASSDGYKQAIEVKRHCPVPEGKASHARTEPNTIDYKGKSVHRTHTGIRYRPGSAGGTPDSRSPRKPTRGGGRGRGRGYAHSGGRRGKQKGRGGRGGESPEPPNRRRPLSQDDRVEISMLKARQQELKRFFKVVGAQQIDILDQLAVGDLSKICQKPKAHKHVPEHEMVTDALEGLMEDTQEMIKARYRVKMEHEERRMRQETEVIEQKYQTHVTEARKEHLAGAEGDIILFERAYRAAHDDTHTEFGSELDYFPRYHELPEADTQPRGYVSRRIMDEKPFKQQLASFDEQACQEVLNEDVIVPLLQHMERRNIEWREEQIRKQSQNLDALSAEAIKELETLHEHLAARPPKLDDGGSYALSALADVSEWSAQQQPERQSSYMPLAPADGFPRGNGLDYSPLPGQSTISHPVSRPGSSGQFKHVNAMNGPFSTLLPLPNPLAAIGPGDRTLPRIVSSGPGQPIAPAPPKQSTVLRPSGPPLFRYSTRMGSGSQASPTSTNGSQQFIFQPPQQPYQHQPAPRRASTPQYGQTSSRAPAGQQTKIPMTFVNQTIASRNAAAASASSPGSGTGNGNSKGGQRLLLPKV